MENATGIRSRRVLGFGAIFLTALISLSLVFTSGTSLQKMSIAKDDSFELNLNRSITTSEISSGEATFITAKGSNIDFKFSGASQNVSGLISLSSDGYFYNETKITGISKIETVLASGSATLAYGDTPTSLYAGSAVLNGSSLITINFSKPSDYFRIANVNGTLSISSMIISFYCDNTYPEDEHEGALEFTRSSTWADGELNHYFAEPNVVSVANDIVEFEVKFITVTGQFMFYLNKGLDASYCGPIVLDAAYGNLTGNGAYLASLANGWYHIRIDLSLTVKTSDIPQYVDRLNIFNTTANGFVRFVNKDSSDIHRDAKEFTSSATWVDGTTNYYFVEPANSKVIDVTTDVIAFDINFKSNKGQFAFWLNEYNTAKYCGPFTLTSSGILTGSGASLIILNNGWYRIILDLSLTDKSDTNPSYVSRINLVSWSTNAAGFVKYVSRFTANSKEFEAGGAWKDGTVNHYFVEPANSKVIDPETDTIAFDIKITSETGQISFYLNEYFYARYVGPFTVTKTGGLSGTGASIAALEHDWYRLTIKLADTVKSSPAPSYVSRINLSASTDGDGYIKYIGVVN